jgi:hypothetical protein
MAEPARRRSLLDFAIVASVAVLPVLLAVLLGIGRWSERSAEPSADRHVSARQLAALRTFEHAIVRRDAVRAPLPDAERLLSALPECATEWRAPDGALERLKRMFGEQHVRGLAPAQTIAARLAELDAALLRLGSGANRRVADAVGFDVERWVSASRAALATPAASALYPDLAFHVRCSDLASAVAALSRRQGRMLAALAWRGTEVDRTTASWRPDQYVAVSAQHLARSNPWSGLPGCIFLVGTKPDERGALPAYFVEAPRQANGPVCAQPSLFDVAAGESGAPSPRPIAGEPTPDLAIDDERWRVPPSLGAMLQPLDALRQPTGTLYRALARKMVPQAGIRATNRARLDGIEVDVGFSVDVTIEPELQALAQKVAACYTGRHDVCRALAIRRAEDGANPLGHRLLEQAMVRMAAIAIIDVPSGRIEALAGALSPCTRQENDGPGRDPMCDKRLPYPVRYRPDALLNPAVFHDAMPASLVKPVMAAAFLSNATVGSRWLAAERAAMRSASPPSRDSLRGELMRSDSARFLDRMFCSDRDFRACERPWQVQASASAFGWNGGCASTSDQCGKRDLLFGRSIGSSPAQDIAPIASIVPYGRLLVEPGDAKLGAPFRTRPAVALDTGKLQRCALGADGRRASGDEWEKCSGGMIVDVVAEGWGQGHARATALGATGMIASLAAAANGEREGRKPHLVRAVRGVADTDVALAESTAAAWAASANESNPIARDAAEVILSGLSFSHRHGTARRACEQVLDAPACRDIDWIAGKTGTPTFPNDERSLDELAKLCAPGVKRTSAEQIACGGLRPYKWYVAAYRGDRSDPRWTKAIGVLTERNWLADSGRIHAAGDHGPNPAAEIAFQVIARQTGLLAKDPR